MQIGTRAGFRVVEDAACADRQRGLWNGTWEQIGRPHGDVACFSFHPRKVVTTGDGGMLTTANPDIDRKFRLWRQHGMSVPDTVRHGSREVIFESYPEVGFNYRMTDIQAAIGRVQLTRLARHPGRRRAMAAAYATRLAGIAGVHAPHEPAWARSNWQSYCVRLSSGFDQRVVMQAMLDAGISTRRGVMNSHLETPYASEGKRASLPKSEEAQQATVILPLPGRMTLAEVDHVTEALRSALAAG